MSGSRSSIRSPRADTELIWHASSKGGPIESCYFRELRATWKWFSAVIEFSGFTAEEVLIGFCNSTWKRPVSTAVIRRCGRWDVRLLQTQSRGNDSLPLPKATLRRIPWSSAARPERSFMIRAGYDCSALITGHWSEKLAPMAAFMFDGRRQPTHRRWSICLNSRLCNYLSVNRQTAERPQFCTGGHCRDV